MNGDDKLKNQIERQARRMKKAEHERPTLIAQTAFIGVLGLLFVLPVVGGSVQRFSGRNFICLSSCFDRGG